jgi:integrase
MSKVKYNLRKPNSKSETLIMMIFHFDGDKLRISTGRSIIPVYWNSKKQRAKELMEFKEHYSLNQYLEKQSSIITDEYNNLLLVNGYADKDVLKDRYLNHQPHKKKRPLSFWDFFEEFIEFKRKELNDIKDYNNSLRKHLIATEKILKRKATFDGIKKIHNGFVYAMKEYLTKEAINSKGKKGLTVNSIGKQFKNLKVFLNWCFENNFIDQFSIKHIVNTTEDVDDVFLEKEEIERLIKLNLKDNIERRVRDGFILSCNTALRFGDLQSLRSSHINFKQGKGTITIQQSKTGGRKIVIPINKISDKILKRYDNNSPIGNIKIPIFNTTIRELCERVNINENVVVYRTEVGEKIEYDHKKFELVSSHSGRRTFCTLKMKQGIPIDVIMSVSGHKSYKSFFRYLKMKPNEYAEEMRKYMD